MTIRQWAEANGFKAADVAKVLSGFWAGRYGKAHNIAVALGIKEGVRTDVAANDGQA